ncbi:MAG: diguanylate cyclase [Solirubrobacteraceae bacterium]
MPLDARDPSRAALRLAPFAAAALLAWLAIPIGSTVDWRTYAAATAVLAVPIALAYLSARGRLRPAWGLLPAALAFMAAVALLRNSAGGSSSGVAEMAMIPVFYIALYSPERRHMYVVLSALVAFYLIPIVLIGAPSYPHSQYRTGLLMVTVSSIIGLTTERLVARVHRQTEEAVQRERMLQQVSHAVRRLFDCDEPRGEVCQSARSISRAGVALLLEPGSSGELACTASAGLEAPALLSVPADCIHPVRTVFNTGLPRLVAAEIESCLADRDVWEACGHPESILYQPVIRGSAVVGVLVVGWPGPLTETGPRASVVALLAHEAALAISRADELAALADMAQTDPLTGLPNRRAWDGRLSRAASEGEPVTIAMLDLDNFKLFNDTFGHPAGDRLLKETAAAWREALRVGDLVARLGGEEFGLLLFDCEPRAVVTVTERLRELVSDGQTCSVGIATPHGEEPLEAVMARADRALYDAKDSGRDRACMSL